MELAQRQTLPLLRRLAWFDWLYAAVLAFGAAYAFERYGTYMDGYEKAILVLAVPTFVWLGWGWKPIRSLLLGAGRLSTAAGADFFVGLLSRRRRSRGTTRWEILGCFPGFSSLFVWRDDGL